MSAPGMGEMLYTACYTVHQPGNGGGALAVEWRSNTARSLAASQVKQNPIRFTATMTTMI